MHNSAIQGNERVHGRSRRRDVANETQHVKGLCHSVNNIIVKIMPSGRENPERWVRSSSYLQAILFVLRVKLMKVLLSTLKFMPLSRYHLRTQSMSDCKRLQSFILLTQRKILEPSAHKRQAALQTESQISLTATLNSKVCEDTELRNTRIHGARTGRGEKNQGTRTEVCVQLR